MLLLFLHWSRFRIEKIAIFQNFLLTLIICKNCHCCQISCHYCHNLNDCVIINTWQAHNSHTFFIPVITHGSFDNNFCWSLLLIQPSLTASKAMYMYLESKIELSNCSWSGEAAYFSLTCYCGCWLCYGGYCVTVAYWDYFTTSCINVYHCYSTFCQ